MSNPVTVTISGNSTPLLSGCGECAALRVRLAEAENSRDIARGVADAFRDTISRATGNPDAVHGLMILCQSHKSLAEAEARAGRAEEDIQILTKCLIGWNNQYEYWKSGDHDTPMFEPVELCDAMDVIYRRADAARAAVEGAR